jgi:hypothetical protein
LWPSTSLCFLAFCSTISMLKSIATLHPKLFTSSTSCASRVGQIWCADMITTQVGSFSFLCFDPSQPRPIVSPFEVWLFVSLGPSSAPFEVWLIVSPAHRRPLLKFGSLSAMAHCWPILEFGPLSAFFESTFTSHLLLSLAAHQPLSLWELPSSMDRSSPPPPSSS